MYTFIRRSRAQTKVEKLTLHTVDHLFSLYFPVFQSSELHKSHLSQFKMLIFFFFGSVPVYDATQQLIRLSRVHNRVTSEYYH